MMKNPNKHRYEFSRIVKKGVPYLQVLDNYLAPIVVNKYLFKYDSVKELNGYGAQMIDTILDILSADKNIKPVSYIVPRPKARLEKALQELQDAMEDYDDRTDSHSSFIFKSEELTIETKNNKK